MNSQSVSYISPGRGLNTFSKIVSGATLFLIFVGALVNSTGSGLAVPDWPLSYGTLFPPMVGGVFYEHSHRMVASVVGLLTLILAIWLARREKRKWVRNSGFLALGAVVLQGILGGITVKFFLPTPISVFHGVLAQTFFILTCLIAYSQSKERSIREEEKGQDPAGHFLSLSLILIVIVYVQLMIAAVMRHTHSGLAIPDFPTMGGSYLPLFNESILSAINAWRFEVNLEPVMMWQVEIHFVHRLMAGVIFLLAAHLTFKAFQYYKDNLLVLKSVFILDLLIFFQILLGILTVLNRKPPYTTSLHVMMGAAVLGVSVLLMLRVSPLQWGEFKKAL